DPPRCARLVPRLVLWPPGQFRHLLEPWHGRTAPDLAGRLEQGALADRPPANAQIVGVLPLAARKQRRAAIAAEMLIADPAIVSRLGVDFGFAPDANLVARADHRHPVRGAGQSLAIRAV